MTEARVREIGLEVMREVQKARFTTHLASLDDHDLYRMGESYAHNMTKDQLFSLLCELEARLRHQEWKTGET